MLDDKYVIELLEDWAICSKRMNGKDKKHLKILFSGLNILNASEKKLLWDYYYLQKTELKEVTDNYSITLSEFNKKSKDIINKMIDPIHNYVENEKKIEEMKLARFRHESLYYLLQLKYLHGSELENAITKSETGLKLCKLFNFKHRVVLRDKYILGKSIEEIGQRLSYRSEKQVIRLLKKALEDFGEVLLQETRG